MRDGRRSFTAIVMADERGRVLVPLPFDPDATWGRRLRHHVAGTVNSMGVRAVIEPLGDRFGILLGAAWRRDCGIGAGDTVTVELAPEGPQRADLPEDLQAALAEDPTAGAFWDSLAQFYRNDYLRWINATKRQPRQRPLRIAETIELLRAGHKQRPQPRP